MTKETIERGLKGWRPERRVLARLLRKRSARGFTPDEFDAWFYRQRRIRFRARHPADFILGGFMGRRRDEMLELLQFMVKLGEADIDGDGRGGVLRYR